MAARRERTGLRAADADRRPLPLSVALVVARSFALAGLATVAVAVAFAAWFLVKAALRVDPVVGTERVWLQYGSVHPPPRDSGSAEPPRPHASLNLSRSQAPPPAVRPCQPRSAQVCCTRGGIRPLARGDSACERSQPPSRCVFGTSLVLVLAFRGNNLVRPRARHRPHDAET